MSWHPVAICHDDGNAATAAGAASSDGDEEAGVWPGKLP